MEDVPREEIDKIIKGIKETVEVLLSNAEAHQLYLLVRKVGKIEGDMAELGVYRGGSARIMREASTEKDLHLFDTFDGLPPLSKIDKSPDLKQGLYAFKLEEVQKNLQNYKNIYYYSGIFPLTVTPVRSKRFSFIHLDADLYESTISALEFFYPRLNTGGVILSHDYPNLCGVKRAFDEFFSDKKETVIQLYPCSQCAVVKVNNL